MVRLSLHSKLTLTALLISAHLSGCKTVETADLATKSMYRPVRENVQSRNYRKAAVSFPQKESGQFVTTFEQAWLDLLNGKADTKKLIDISHDLESRKTVQVSKEAKKFFLKEMDEAYLPAEHEVILFHILTGLHLAKEGNSKAARVEAKRAARYLQGHFGYEDRSDFDSPAIRLLLAALWIYCDDWQEARVDLRVAARQDEAFLWAQKLAKRPQPPKNFVVLLRGVGPEVTAEESKEKLSFENWNLNFVFEENDAPLTLVDGDKKFRFDHSLFSGPWYLRHHERNSLPRQTLDHVRHGVDKAVGFTGAVVVGTFAVIGAVAIIAASIAVSAGIVALAASVDSKGSTDLIGASLRFSAAMIAMALPKAGGVAKSGTGKAKEIYKEADDESESYRYVRFIPSYYYYKPVRELSENPIIHFGEFKFMPQLDLRSATGNRVLFYYIPF